MKANSDTKPKPFTKSGDKLFFNFNVVESEKEDKTPFFDYEYVEVKGQDKNSVIKAIIKDKYSIEDEIALINNKFRAQAPDVVDYDIYQAFRTEAKDKAKF